MISSMVGVSFSHGKSVQKRCICGSGLFKAIETAHPISCWTSSFVIPFFFGNDFQIFINRVCVFIIHSVVVNPF